MISKQDQEIRSASGRFLDNPGVKKETGLVTSVCQDTQQKKNSKLSSQEMYGNVSYVKLHSASFALERKFKFKILPIHF